MKEVMGEARVWGAEAVHSLGERHSRSCVGCEVVRV